MYTESGLRFAGLAFCVELWTKQVSYRISVPMSYTTCLDISLLHIMYYISLATIWEKIAANPRMSIFEKCLKSCFDRPDR